MRILKSIPLIVRKRLDFIITAIALFILFSPQPWWDAMFGDFRFDHLAFAVITILLILVAAADFIERKGRFVMWLRENIWLGLFALALLLAVSTRANLHTRKYAASSGLYPPERWSPPFTR